MNEKIDVLEVMDWLVDKLPYEGEESASRFNEARAAVAELIGAAELVLTRPAMQTIRGRMEMSRRLRVLDAALARVSGGGK